MGLLPKIAEIIQAMRAEELKLSAKYRWFTVCFNMLGTFAKCSSFGLESGNADTDIFCVRTTPHDISPHRYFRLLRHV
jgi:hypothetical protein